MKISILLKNIAFIALSILLLATSLPLVVYANAIMLQDNLGTVPDLNAMTLPDLMGEIDSIVRSSGDDLKNIDSISYETCFRGFHYASAVIALLEDNKIKTDPRSWKNLRNDTTAQLLNYSRLLENKHFVFEAYKLVAGITALYGDEYQSLSEFEEYKRLISKKYNEPNALEAISNRMGKRVHDCEQPWNTVKLFLMNMPQDFSMDDPLIAEFESKIFLLSNARIVLLEKPHEFRYTNEDVIRSLDEQQITEEDSLRILTSIDDVVSARASPRSVIEDFIKGKIPLNKESAYFILKYVDQNTLISYIENSLVAIVTLYPAIENKIATLRKNNSDDPLTAILDNTITELGSMVGNLFDPYLWKNGLDIVIDKPFTDMFNYYNNAGKLLITEMAAENINVGWYAQNDLPLMDIKRGDMTRIINNFKSNFKSHAGPDANEMLFSVTKDRNDPAFIIFEYTNNGLPFPQHVVISGTHSNVGLKNIKDIVERAGGEFTWGNREEKPGVFFRIRIPVYNELNNINDVSASSQALSAA